jgi:hypothetical protein
VFHGVAHRESGRDGIVRGGLFLSALVSPFGVCGARY